MKLNSTTAFKSESGGELSWLIGDHLGSTTVTADSNGSLQGTQLYRAFGEVRPGGVNTLATRYTFTGQVDDSYINLMWFRSRWYDQALGRFIQPDSIVPIATQGVQAWDRFEYANNNAVRYNDPSGHLSCSASNVAEGDCSDLTYEEHLANYGINFGGEIENWTAVRKHAVFAAIRAVSLALAKVIGGTNLDAFHSVYKGGVTFTWVTSYTYQNRTYTSGAVTQSATEIKVASLSEPGGNRTTEMAFTSARNNIVHELGHAFAKQWQDVVTGEYDPGGPYSDVIPSEYLNNVGFYLYPNPESAQETWRQHPCTPIDCTPHEAFADMFLGWTFDKWADDPQKVGEWRDNYMTTNMAEWVAVATRR